MSAEFINRELSWLDFNLRVLNQAIRPEVPAMERLRFIRIFDSNLDEFAMVRIGTLTDQAQLSPQPKDGKTGWKADRQLREIYRTLKDHLAHKEQVMHQVLRILDDQGVRLVYQPEAVTEADLVRFETQIRPFLTPYVLSPRHPMPYLANRQQVVVVQLKKDKHLASGLIMWSGALPPLLLSKQPQHLEACLSEALILHFANRMFPGYTVMDVALIKVLRNADLDLEQLQDTQDEQDYLRVMKALLAHRQKQQPTLLLSSRPLSDSLAKTIGQQLNLPSEAVVVCSVPFSHEYFGTLEKTLRMARRRDLFWPSLTPVPQPFVGRLMQAVQHQEVLLVYPYHSMNGVIDLIEDAATDPEVAMIRITLYRLAEHSRIIEALIDAADHGKQVTVYLELQARFDEENNIRWSNLLEDSRVHVIYGIEPMKIHAKVCEIKMHPRKRKNDIVHIGTGNYNEDTARQYSDLNLISTDKALLRETDQFFEQLGIGTLDFPNNHLLVAPTTLKKGLLALIDQEVAMHHRYQDGHIMIKVNGMTDKQVMEALVLAADAGVQVDLIIRGINCLKPHPNIRVISILGRYLEHARLYVFHQHGRSVVYMGSADLMTRNTEHRVEVLVRAKGAIAKQCLTLLEIQLNDAQAYVQQADGQYVIRPDASGPDAQQKLRAWLSEQHPRQDWFMRIRQLFNR